MGVISFLAALWLGAIPALWQHTVHTDTVAFFFPNGIASARVDAPRQSLDCTPGDHTFQFIWLDKAGETVNTADVDAALTNVAEQINYMFWLDSDSTTAYRLPAWQMTDDCRLDILYMAPGAVINPPTDQHRKYIIIEDAPTFCGRAVLFGDERPVADNANNLSSLLWVARPCINPYVIAHEMLHSMGAVQRGAPNSNDSHTSDFGDVMARPINPKCPRYDTIDCNKDDYWSLTPAPGSYLADHWNSANSAYLVTRPKYRLILQPIFYTERSTP